MSASYYRRLLEHLQEKQEIARLKREIAKLEGDPAHPRSEGWEWDGDLGIWEQRKQAEHIDL